MKKYITIFIILFLTTSIKSQYQNVRISNVISGEDWVSINPENSNQAVVGVTGGWSNSGIGYYYTSNGGYNWNGGPMITTLGIPICDPVVIVDTSGYFYYISMFGFTPNTFLICFKSTDGGINWNNGLLFGLPYPKVDDMPMACVDFSNSQYRNNIYVTWTLYDTVIYSNNPNDSSYVYFSRSTDQGITFSNPTRVGRVAGSIPSHNSNPEGPVPCIGTNGEIYVCFPHNEQVYFNRSTNGGNTWLPNDIFVSSEAGGWILHHSPVIACDLSNSIYRGNIYICFSDLRNGTNDRDIWLTKSTDLGNTWSTVVRVNDDGPGHNQEEPWINIDPLTGYIWIDFYDTRNYTSQTTADLYIARSTNGGASFQNVKVSTNPTHLTGWYGDYIGISAYNNKVRPVWTRTINGLNNELWTAIIDTFVIGINPISNIIPEEFKLSQNYPNPFNPSTKIKFDIRPPLTPLLGKEGTRVVLKIFDILGREVATLVNEELKPGSYEYEWDASNFASGVYFYKLTISDASSPISITKRMVLIK